MTALPTEFFVVDVGDLLALGKSVAEAFLSFSKVIPSDTTLRRALIETTRWNAFKKDMIKDV